MSLSHFKILMIDSLVGNDYSVFLCSHLKKIGNDICLVTTANRTIHSKINFQVKRWAPSKSQSANKIKKLFLYLSYLWKIWISALRDRDILVHFQFPRRIRIESLFIFYLRLSGVKIIFTSHNILPHEYKKIDYFFRYILLKSSVAIIVHSNYIKKELMKTFHVCSEKIFIIPHGDLLFEPRISQNEARKELNLRTYDKVLLFFGLIREYKGLDVLIAAFRLAIKQEKKLKLLIAGNPFNEQLNKRYQMLIQKQNLNDRISYRPEFIPREEVSSYFTAADIVVLPYKKIAHSGVIQMAYSFGKPVIATKVGDFPDMIVQNKNGFLVNKNKPEELAEVILKAFRNPAVLIQIGKYNQRLGESLYSWEIAAWKSNEVYKSLINRNDRIS